MGVSLVSGQRPVRRCSRDWVGGAYRAWYRGKLGILIGFTKSIELGSRLGTTPKCMELLHCFCRQPLGLTAANGQLLRGRRISHARPQRTRSF